VHQSQGGHFEAVGNHNDRDARKRLINRPLAAGGLRLCSPPPPPLASTGLYRRGSQQQIFDSLGRHPDDAGPDRGPWRRPTVRSLNAPAPIAAPLAQRPTERTEDRGTRRIEPAGGSTARSTSNFKLGGDVPPPAVQQAHQARRALASSEAERGVARNHQAATPTPKRGAIPTIRNTVRTRAESVPKRYLITNFRLLRKNLVRRLGKQKSRKNPADPFSRKSTVSGRHIWIHRKTGAGRLGGSRAWIPKKCEPRDRSCSKSKGL